MCADGKLVVDHIKVERERIDQTGDYDLEALFIRIRYAIEEVVAKRVVLDTIEVLFSALDDTARLRAELRRLFAWLKGQNVTAIVATERGEGALTCHGLEEYVADCVISLDYRVDNQIAVRRIRIVKQRGSSHGTNEYPFLIGVKGLTVVLVTSFQLNHPASRDIVSTGIPELDEMAGRGGWYKGSTNMISGESGTGKATFAAAFAEAACKRGERCLYLAFEESGQQLVRNMSSVGIDLRHWIDEGNLLIHASRPTVLTTTMELDELLARLTRVLTPMAADWCVIELVDQNGLVDHVAASHRARNTARPFAWPPPGSPSTETARWRRCSVRVRPASPAPRRSPCSRAARRRCTRA